MTFVYVGIAIIVGALALIYIAAVGFCWHLDRKCNARAPNANDL